MKISKSYLNKIQCIKEAIKSSDPAGIIFYPAPYDEYDELANKIFNWYISNSPKENLFSTEVLFSMMNFSQKKRQDKNVVHILDMLVNILNVNLKKKILSHVEFDSTK